LNQKFFLFKGEALKNKNLIKRGDCRGRKPPAELWVSKTVCFKISNLQKIFMEVKV